MAGGKLSAIIKQYSVTLVMIPSIFLMHYAWLKLQNVESLVSKDERDSLKLYNFFTHTNSAKEFDNNIRTFRHQPD